MNFDTYDTILHVALWLMLGSLASGICFALSKRNALRCIAVCFSGFCFCLYAPLGWFVIWSFIYPLFGEEGISGIIGQLLALALTPLVFVSVSIAAYAIIRNLNSENPPT